jgi:hypothetical protein
MNERTMKKNLNFLVPIDFFPESEAALSYAITVGTQVGASLHLIHILEEESSILWYVISDKQREMIPTSPC